MNYQIAVIPGDGIGPDVVEQTLNVMDKVGEKFGHTFNYTKVLAGGCAIDATGACLPQETIDICKASDAVLLGAVGGWKWDNLPGDQRPERALLGLRKALGLFANLRPALLFEQLADASPLKPEILAGGLDIVVVRELTGGIYFGEKGHRDTDLGPAAYDIEQYAEGEVRRIAKVAFDMAMKRSKHVTSVDKANVLDTSRLWRKVVHEVAEEYPDVTCSDLLVDNAAMQLVRDPSQFDVIVTENLFGDILSDEASMITGSIGMMASASLGEGTRGMYEPIHGSAPDIAGKDIANPIGTILSAAMMLRYSLDLPEEAGCIESAVDRVLDAGYRTADIFEEGCIRVDSCKAAAEYLCGRPGNVLIATSSKALRDYGCLEPERMYPRVLPTHAALNICEEMGIPHRNILALQGPFTLAMNAAMLEQYHISYLVTKDGGTVGGFTEKQQAARQTGAQLILVGRPPDSGESMEQLLRELEEWA